MINDEMLSINDRTKSTIIILFKIIVKSQFTYHITVFAIKTLRNSQAAVSHKIEHSHTK